MKLNALLFEMVENYNCASHVVETETGGLLLTSLTQINIPNEVINFACSNNELTDLKGSPKKVLGHFFADENQLTSLEGAPPEVGSYFSCEKNQLTSLKGIPSIIDGLLYVNNNKLTSLQGIHKLVKSVRSEANFFDNPIKSHVLGLLKIKDLRRVGLDNMDVSAIINKHLQGARDIFACQEELEEAGFEEFAKL